MMQYIQYYPKIQLLIGLLIVFVLDFVCGVTKATLTGKRRTSKGFRKTFSKFIQYGVSIVVALVILNIGNDGKSDISKQISWLFGDFMIFLMIYIEIVSIFENIEVINPESDFVKYFIRPVRRLLTFQIKNLLRDETEK
ncbi:phage holin family protein [Chryseobacterium cucumeris]|uniref:phage holin family protein n=1 Tax=Chryseobacterium cucumeris TaxID=1813611 RepID=UPI001F4AD3AC|nr:phage holin family protein [Chryseobacterium cucumeris]